MSHARRTLIFIFLLAFCTSGKCFATSTEARLQPLSVEDRQILSEGEMSTTRYVISGVLGTYPGFGIGHAIQGRWLDIGWVFTVGELVSGTLAIASMFGCGGSHGQDSTGCRNAGAFSVVFVSLKIWEIVDIWHKPYAHDQRYRELKRQGERQSPTRAYFAPTDNGLLAGLSFDF